MNPHPLLTLRRCNNCRYIVDPGYEHEIIPQQGKSHVLCKLVKVECMTQFGRCKVCRAWCTRTFRVDTSETVATEHRGPVPFDHPADPVPAALAETLDAYLTYKGVHPE